MDRYEGICHLDWWANSSTAFGAGEVSVVITSDGDTWSAHGHLLEPDPEALEGFTFLCDLDPVFTLRFPDDATIEVSVHPAAEPGHFTMAEYTSPATRPVSL
ncbi:hypothetical protein GCM10009827_098730 [Dactylosporangium maewongense]|uniref:Uncharacterized protein n=1 Tax=Dactylosporangium maewongense TaxID=634393 RepID=A0ABN2CNH1_9ACTN